MRPPRIARALLCCLSPALLAACGDGGIPAVQQWMDETRRQTRVVVPKLTEPKKFTPFTYAGKSAPDPYSPAKFVNAMATPAASGNRFQPNLDRRREPLEAFPLDNLKMVGTLRKQGASFVLVQADHTIFQAKVGTYIGQNYGQVTRITDSEVELKETVQDAAGEWVERTAKLELQENKK
jgi:type IV pilus assembly protein PilP